MERKKKEKSLLGGTRFIMKFSELTLAQWEEWKPYLDTCLLPITGLNGYENPIEASAKLEQLRDWIELAETPFYGRMVTYPAYHFAVPADKGDSQWETVNRLVERLKKLGFKYVVVMSSHLDLAGELLPAADLVLTPYSQAQSEYTQASDYIKANVVEMWTDS